MQYKVIFHAFIDGKKQNLDAVFESATDPKVTDIAVGRAAMQALSEVLDARSATFTVTFNIDAIVPVP
ncbi:hypothetical protein AB2515_04085 [Klebsiella pneumoniae]|uniref:hypothetical protein n=1 Tax=Klebsiella pneumoniae TaxID=573 RepID=UPI0034645C7E|nr:hypothetical protein [Klebsiella pneumoniae]